MDFEGPISSEEKQAPGVVTRLVEEVKRKNLLLHAKEREIEAKDDQLRRLREKDQPETGVDVDVDRRYPPRGYHIELEALEQYWWVAAIMAVALVLFALR